MSKSMKRMVTALHQRQWGRTKWWVLLAVVMGLLTVWFAWWFFTHYERVTETTRLPARGEAVRNPYYAAELFLRKQGLEVESLGSNTPLVRLPASNDVIFARRIGASVTEHHVDGLLEWVEQGGTLIVESHDVLSDDDLEELGTCEAVDCDDEEQAGALAEESQEDIENQLLARLGVYLQYASFDGESKEDESENYGRRDEEEGQAQATDEARRVEDVLRELNELERRSEGRSGDNGSKIDKPKSAKAKRESSDDSMAEDERDSVPVSSQSRREQGEVSGEDEYESIAPAEVELFDGETALVAVNTLFTLVDSDGVAAQQWQHDGVVYMLRVDRGKGSIWVLNDTDFIQSVGSMGFLRELRSVDTYEIERHDHAYFFYQLVTGRVKNGVDSKVQSSVGDIGKVWLLYSADAKPLYQLLWDKAHWAIKGFALLLLVWLWWMSNRFGPPLGSLEPPRRNLLEHLRMSGSFAWQQDEGKRLWQHNRDHILAEMVRKHPRLGKMDTAKQAQTLSDVTGYPASAIHRALFEQCEGERDFVYLTDMLRRIQKKM